MSFGKNYERVGNRILKKRGKNELIKIMRESKLCQLGGIFLLCFWIQSLSSLIKQKIMSQLTSSSFFLFVFITTFHINIFKKLMVDYS